MAKANIKKLIDQLGNPEADRHHRQLQLRDILRGAEEGESGDYQAILDEVFDRIETKTADEMAQKRAKFLKDLVDQLSAAPLRCGTFVGLTPITSAIAPHALVSLDNGDLAYLVVPDPRLAQELKLGQRVLADGSGKLVLSPEIDDLRFGPESRLERRIDLKHIEVTTHNDEKQVLLAGPELIAAITAGDIQPGSAVVMDRGQRVALYALPAEDKLHFRFLDRGAVPDIVVGRDIGAPPKVIGEVERHVREEMTRPGLRRKFGLRPCITKLLCGPSGTGKTLAIQAIHRRLYEIMSEVTGTPVAELPPRVFRFRASKIFSMWFGESDKNMDRIFDEVEQAADIRHTNKKGQEFTLPVMVIMEEADGMGRKRGEDNIYDRIITTLLQRLDPNRHGLSSKLVVFLSSTNEPHIVDPAFLRRIGGTVENFGRLSRESFSAVLQKHVDGLPTGAGEQWDKIIDGVNRWLYAPGIDEGVLEIHYDGWSKPHVKYHRDFLTGALIDRAVQEAAAAAWQQAIADEPDAGLSGEGVLAALQQQVKSVASQITPHNAASYLDIPEGAKVASVRRLYGR